MGSDPVAAGDCPPVTKPRPIRGWLEVVSIVVLIPVGGLLGALSGFPPLSAILSVALPLIVATLYLRREGTAWRSLVLHTRLSATAVSAYTVVALVVTFVLVGITAAAMSSAGLPPTDLSALQALLEGNFAMYLWFLIPVAWGSAAVGEELLARGTPDLLLMEHTLPDRNGLDYAEELRHRLGPDCFPIVLMSARLSNDSRLSGIESAADEFLAKPLVVRDVHD